MIRSVIVCLLVFLSFPSNTSAQSCVGNPVAVQVLGSGGASVNDRASSSYLLWIDAELKKFYTGPLTVGADLQCTSVL